MKVKQFRIADILVIPTRTHRPEDDAMTQRLRELLSEIKKLRKRRILLRFKHLKDSSWKEECEHLAETMKTLYKEFSLINRRRHRLKKVFDFRDTVSRHIMLPAFFIRNLKLCA